MNYVFDVDGTLTESRQRMDEDFAVFFREWMKDKKVFLATGSDFPKTKEQVPQDILDACEKIYCCAGNSVWSQGEEVSSDDWRLPDDCIEFLDQYLYTSSFPYRTGVHFEHRPGLCNFSIIGRRCTLDQRQEYENWDFVSQEREKIAEAFNAKFSDAYGIRAQVAGATGIDIMKDGKDKSQIANHLSGPIVFFGDKMEAGGNDYPLAEAIDGRKDSAAIMVKDWKDTYAYLHG